MTGLLKFVGGVLLAVAIASCGGGGGGGGSGGGGGGAQVGTVSGKVVSSADGSPVANATVKAGSSSTTTSVNGDYTLSTSPGDRVVVHTEASGFAESFSIAKVSTGAASSVHVRLIPVAVTQPLAVATGGSITVPNSSARIEIPAGGLAPNSGGSTSATVNVSLTPIDPATSPNLMPGDYTAVQTGTGATTRIESFGALLVDIRDAAGTRYNLTGGKTSTIRIPLGTKNLLPPASVPLYFLDESTGRWVEEGTATLQGTPPNQYYEGTVSHFSYWNADQPQQSIVVSGCVHDLNGLPAANIPVSSEGDDYSGSDGAVTNTSGEFRLGMKRGGVASIFGREFNLTTANFETNTNVAKAGPSDVDITLATCLKLTPRNLKINTSQLSVAKAGVAYSATMTAANGTLPLTWSISAGSLPAGLGLNSTTGQISGINNAVGSTNITVKVQDSSNPPQMATKQLTLIVASATTGGGGGAITVSNAPAAVGGGFSPDAQFTSTRVSGANGIISSFESLGVYTELLSATFDLQSGQMVFLLFNTLDRPGGTTWVCLGSEPTGCAGATYDRGTGTLTLSNVTLTSRNSSAAPITLNGSMTVPVF